MAGHRREFDRQLDAIDAKVIELFAIVCEDLPGVTQAILTGSHDGYQRLADHAVNIARRTSYLAWSPTQRMRPPVR